MSSSFATHVVMQILIYMEHAAFLFLGVQHLNFKSLDKWPSSVTPPDPHHSIISYVHWRSVSWGATITEQHKNDIQTERNHQLSFIKLGSKLDKRIASKMKFSILAQAVIFLNGKFRTKF